MSSTVPGRKGFTYPNPVLLPREKNTLYLFWRGANWSADYATRTSGGHWSASHQLIRISHERPYLKVDSNGSNTIALAFTNGHPRNLPTSIYYAAYRSGWLWTAGGRRIARMGQRADRPVPGRPCLQRARVGCPVLGVGRGAAPRRPSGDRLRHVPAQTPITPTGTRASTAGAGSRTSSRTPGRRSARPRSSTSTRAGSRSITAIPPIVYLSRKVGGSYQIERWVTTDGGAKWRHRVVVRGGAVDNVRPVVPRGSDGGPMSLLWLRGDYVNYRSYRTDIAYLR